MNVPGDLKYTKDHEWVRERSGDYVVGITEFAQAELGDIVFVELPEVGRALEKGKPLGVVESVKAVSDVFAPLNGQVTERNEQLAGSPQLINEDPYGKGWLIAMKCAPSELQGLMSAQEYSAYLASVSGS